MRTTSPPAARHEPPPAESVGPSPVKRAASGLLGIFGTQVRAARPMPPHAANHQAWHWFTAWRLHRNVWCGGAPGDPLSVTDGMCSLGAPPSLGADRRRLR